MSDSNVSGVDVVKLRELFDSYDRADAVVDNARAELEKAIKGRSDVVALILEANNGSKKIVRKGEKLSICVRNTTYFFRGKSKDGDDITEV